MVLYFSQETLDQIRRTYAIGSFRWGREKQNRERKGKGKWYRQWTPSAEAPVAGEELLHSAARLRFSVQLPDCRRKMKNFTSAKVQIPNCRRETQAFSSALRDAVFGWEVPALVKKVLTLVRSVTRSGRAYGLDPAPTPVFVPKHAYWFRGGAINGVMDGIVAKSYRRGGIPSIRQSPPVLCAYPRLKSRDPGPARRDLFRSIVDRLAGRSC